LTLAHNCALLKVHVDTSRLFGEPWGDYHTALRLTCDRVDESTRQAEARARAEMRKT
jgi:hypothetical protein